MWRATAALRAAQHQPGIWQRSLNIQHNAPTSGISDMPTKLENPYKESPKRCTLCGIEVNYKNVQLLSQFVSPYTGHIFGRHITGLCGNKQKQVAKAIKRAQHMGFMPVTQKDPTFIKDPNICDIKLLE
ncbi:28S ribosomal protein S18c, mitochondrial [Callorhinchus milii]|uniref:Small ribosomal subunit protein bS18m n=1 Tax=Callorhinchus milii TaxID=7868 RepID=V9LIU2_CALMI|nr:28S ribosomal protein S18c, mitochondrial [Callorhinchus milii]|eukprot:gi/632978413/ref/XP_007905900.1/ PREDICTED: 28S ribosomal protein S18c, mitochondrial [Callorhinchus milii]